MVSCTGVRCLLSSSDHSLYVIVLVVPYFNVNLVLVSHTIIFCFVGHILYYWSYLIIHHFEYMMSNVALASSNIQYSKSCLHIVPINTHWDGCKYYLTIQLIPLLGIACIFLCDSISMEIECESLRFFLRDFMHSTIIPVVIPYVSLCKVIFLYFTILIVCSFNILSTLKQFPSPIFFYIVFRIYFMRRYSQEDQLMSWIKYLN